MNLRKRIGPLASIAALLGVISLAAAQEGGGPPIPRPTAEHKVLTADAGDWDAEIKSFMGGPDADPMTSKGTEVNKVMTGGLWLLSEFKGDFGGVPFEGRGQFGFDPIKKKYVGTWIDSMSPSLAVLEGSYDARTKTMTFEGEGVDPATRSKYTQKMVTTLKDDGTRVFTLFMKSPETGGQEVKFMEVTYTRKKERRSR